MTKIQIETWALRLVDSVDRKQPLEDILTELKADWPADFDAAARRVAGHANSAQGEPILWLIGVDEKLGVVGAANQDINAWYDQLAARFDELSPRMTPLIVPTGKEKVVALLFETDRAPFVVKNPSGNLPHREVPYRHATGLRTATRSDLVRILDPLQLLPQAEPIQGVVTVGCRPFRIDSHGAQIEEESLLWELQLELYVAPHPNDQVVIPFHKCSGGITIHGAIPRAAWQRVSMSASIGWSDTAACEPSHGIAASGHEVILEAPGMISLGAHAYSSTEAPPLKQQDEVVEVDLALRPTFAHVPLTLLLRFTYSDRDRYVLTRAQPVSVEEN